MDGGKDIGNTEESHIRKILEFAGGKKANVSVDFGVFKGVVNVKAAETLSGFFSYFSKILNLQCKASVTMMGRLMNHSNWQHPLGKRLFWKHFFVAGVFFYFHSTKKFS